MQYFSVEYLFAVSVIFFFFFFLNSSSILSVEALSKEYLILIDLNLSLGSFTLQFETATWQNVILKHLCTIDILNVKSHEKKKKFEVVAQFLKLEFDPI